MTSQGSAARSPEEKQRATRKHAAILMDQINRLFAETQIRVYRVSTDIHCGEWVTDPEVLTELVRCYQEAEMQLCYSGRKGTTITREGNTLNHASAICFAA
jgi:hypothetical protein